MKNIKLLLLAFPISLVVMASCKKKGCTDSDAVNFSSSAEKSDYSCKYSYLKSITVDANQNINFDPLNGPDLYVKFAKSSSSSWDNVTSTNDNIYSTTWNLVNETKMLNENWDYEVFDEENLTSDEKIIFGTYNPVSDLNADNQIIQTNSNGTITFKFDVK